MIIMMKQVRKSTRTAVFDIKKPTTCQFVACNNAQFGEGVIHVAGL